MDGNDERGTAQPRGSVELLTRVVRWGGWGGRSGWAELALVSVTRFGTDRNVCATCPICLGKPFGTGQRAGRNGSRSTSERRSAPGR